MRVKYFYESKRIKVIKYIFHSILLAIDTYYKKFSNYLIKYLSNTVNNCRIIKKTIGL